MNASEVLIQHLPSLLFASFGIVFLIVGMALGASDRKYLKTSFETTGKIVKYWSEDYHTGDRPCIEFEHEGEQIVVRAQDWIRDDENQPPVGTTVRVRCQKSRALGQDVWDVRLVRDNEMQMTVIRIGNGIAIAGGVLVAVALILFLKGV